MKPTATLKFTSRMSAADCEKAIASISNRGAKLDGDIQLTALSVLAHVIENREVSLACKLYHGMPAGSRRNALVEWFLLFGPVAVNMDKDSKKERPLIFAKDKTGDLVEAEKKAWFTCKPEANPDVAFNTDAFIARIQSQLRKLSEKGELPADERLLAILALAPVASNDKTVGEVVQLATA